MKTVAFASTCLILVLVGSVFTSSTSTEEADVRQAAVDYVNALYTADPSLVSQSVHPELVKYGYSHREGEYHGAPMSFDELVDLASRWNRDQQRFDPDTTRFTVDVYDVLDQTASAKITAQWGSDYLLLARHEGRWMIRQILWQSPPPPTR